jgi:hypothetical protein
MIVLRCTPTLTSEWNSNAHERSKQIRAKAQWNEAYGGDRISMNITFLVLMAGMVLGGVLSAGVMALAWKRRRIVGSVLFLLLSLLMFTSAAAVLLLAAGAKGYRAFTREELAATVHITPLARQLFRAQVVLPDGRDTAFVIAGDELYLDARVLKWKPYLNFIGLHTAYRLDRVAGRYVSMRDEKEKTRTTHTLEGEMMPWDLFFLRTRYAFLAPLLDAKYGSAAFAPMDGAGTVRIMVTTSGLIARTD